MSNLSKLKDTKMRTKRVGSITCTLLLVFVALSQHGLAKAPGWLRQAQRIALPDYAEETEAITLLDETRIVVTDGGEIRTRGRGAIRILSSEATELARVRLSFDRETTISRLEAWNIKPEGVVHEVSKKDAVETQLNSIAFFEDDKELILQIPRAEPGSVIGYEYERRNRPHVLQKIWPVQGRQPVLRARFVLDLPKGWSYRYRILNYPNLVPKEVRERRWVWEFDDVPGVAREDRMPPLSAVAAALAVTFLPKEGDGGGETFETWDDVARWFTGFVVPRAKPSKEIASKSAELVSARERAEFVQKQIRYVAIEIGIGGYRPHAASETFRTRYGDCKDKVTLLKSLFQSAHVSVYPVLIHSSRKKMDPEFPSPFYFNHMIAAIPVPDGESRARAVIQHPVLGPLLLFDPTSAETPYGQLPANLQGTKALLARGGSGELIDTPKAPASVNRIMRVGRFRMTQEGILLGKVMERYLGESGVAERSALLGQSHAEWVRRAEVFLAPTLPGVRVNRLGVASLEETTTVSENLDIVAPFFGERQGDLLLLRPCVFGSKFERLASDTARRYPLQFEYPRVSSDDFEVQLPDGFQVEDLPAPVEHDVGFAHYKAGVTQDGSTIKYLRKLEIRQLSIPPEEVEKFRELQRLIDRDEKNVLIARKVDETLVTDKQAAQSQP